MWKRAGIVHTSSWEFFSGKECSDDIEQYTVVSCGRDGEDGGPVWGRGLLGVSEDEDGEGKEGS